MTDPISDMLTRIRNAVMVRKLEVVLPHSKLKAALAEILAREGYLESVSEMAAAPTKNLVLKIRYQGNEPAIRSLRRVSTPGRRHYVKSFELPRVLSGLGMAVVSTSQGLMTNKEARQKKLGGEVICEIY